jgi:NADH-quinone oxidoreductase subunit L
MTRQVALVFFGQGRWGDDAGHADAQAAHADAEAPRTDAQSGGEAPQSTPEPVAAGGHGGHGAANPHESPPTMWVPLVVLAVLAFAGGVINLPWAKANFLDRWLEPVVGHVSAAHSLGTTGKELSALATTILCLAGIGLGFRVWGTSAEHSGLEPVVLRRAWLIDPLYAAVIERPGLVLARLSAAGDKSIIDGAVTGTGLLVRGGGGVLRKLQTGYVRNYALGITAGTVAMLAYVAVRAH